MGFEYVMAYKVCSSGKAVNGLWKIEESFRVLKSNFEARPIFVLTKSSIEGHFVLCYLALVIQRYLEYILQQKNVKISTERIHEALKSANLIIITKIKSDKEYYLKSKSNKDYEMIRQALWLPNIPQYGKVKEVLILRYIPQDKCQAP